jgi:hypothetical protein
MTTIFAAEKASILSGTEDPKRVLPVKVVGQLPLDPSFGKAAGGTQISLACAEGVNACKFNRTAIRKAKTAT